MNFFFIRLEGKFGKIRFLFSFVKEEEREAGRCCLGLAFPFSTLFKTDSPLGAASG